MCGMMGRKETLVSYATFCGYVHFPQSRDQSFWSPPQWALGAEFENHHKNRSWMICVLAGVGGDPGQSPEEKDEERDSRVEVEAGI